MTTQPETTVVERVSRIEGVVEQINLRLAENHDDIQALRAESRAEFQALGAKIDAQNEKIDTVTQALREKIDAQGKEFRAETQSLGAKIDAQGKELNEKIDRLRGEMHRQALFIVGILGGLMALLRFVG